MSTSRRKRALLALIGITVVAQTAFARENAVPPRAQKAWNALNTGSNGWSASWIEEEGVPNTLRPVGREVLPGWNRGRGAAAVAFFERNADLFGLRRGRDAFRVQGERTHLGIHHLRAVQTYRGVPVRGGEYMVSVAVDGSLRLIAGQSIPDIDCPTAAGISRKQAEDVAAAAVGSPSTSYEVSAELAIEPATGPDRLVYALRLNGRGDNHQSWEVLVDAATGEAGTPTDLVRHLTGRVNVYAEDPTSPLTQRDLTVDHDPVTDLAILRNSVATVPPENLYSDALLPPNWTVYSFQYSPTLGGGADFDRGNVFAHMDYFIRTFQGANGLDLQNFPQISGYIGTESCVNSPGLAYAGDDWIVLTGSCAARVSDIIYHELQHTVNAFFGFSGLSMFDEGIADYFACAASNDPVFVEYLPAWTRVCNSSPSEFNASNETSIGHFYRPQIVSGLFWDIRTAVGASTGDKLALESLAYLPGSPSYACIAAGLLQADFDHHAGQNQTTILAKLEARGFELAPSCAINGPSELGPDEYGEWEANITCGAPPFTYQWSKVTQGTTTTLGTDSTQTTSSSQDFTLRVEVHDAVGNVLVREKAVDVRLVVSIDGPDEVQPSLYQYTEFIADVESGLNEYQEYEWKRKFNIPGAAWVLVGDGGPSLLVSAKRGYQLMLTVTENGAAGSATKPVSVYGAPSAAIVSGPGTLNGGVTATYTGQGSGGITPYTYKWYRGCLTQACVVGTGSSVQITGTGSAFDLYFTVISANGAESDMVLKHVTADPE